MSQYFKFIVDQTYSSKRLDKFLHEKLPQYSRSRIQKIIKESDNVMVNQNIINDISFSIQPNHIITISISDSKPLNVTALKMDLDILFEDEHLIVIHKDAGIVVHPSHGHRDYSLVHGLLHHAKHELSGIGGIERPGIVHRLDKDTSGIMVVCKTEQAHIRLAEDFKNHHIERRYIALTYGCPPMQAGTIDKAICRDSVHRKRQMIAPPDKGKNATTKYKIIQHYHKYFSKIECCLLTGRTHQVRVHLSHIHCPLIGDSLYGHSYRSIPNHLHHQPIHHIITNFQRQALHAYVLGFQHPITKKDYHFTRSPPKDMEELEHALQTIQPPPIFS